MGKEYKLTSEQIEAIEKAVKKADRIEIIPGKDGLKITAIQRKEVKEPLPKLSVMKSKRCYHNDSAAFLFDNSIYTLL